MPTQLGSSHFVGSLSDNVLSLVGPGDVWGASLVIACVTVAFVVGARGIPRTRPTAARTRASLPAVLFAVAVGYLVVAANVFALTGYPYGNDPENLVRVRTSISGTPTTLRPGDQVGVRVSVENGKYLGVGGVTLTIVLPPACAWSGNPPSPAAPVVPAPRLSSVTSTR